MKESPFNSKMKQIEENLAKIGVLLIVVIVFMNSVLRFFKMPLSWAPDIAQLIFAWTIFLGADLALQQRKHIGVEILEVKFKEKHRTALRVLWGFLIMGFLGVCIYYGTNLCVQNSLRRLNGVPISYSWLTASVPFGCVVMLRTTICNLIEDINILRNKNTRVGEVQL